MIAYKRLIVAQGYVFSPITLHIWTPDKNGYAELSTDQTLTPDGYEGIHSLKDRHSKEFRWYEGKTRAIQVFGTVIEGEMGYRSTHARTRIKLPAWPPPEIVTNTVNRHIEIWKRWLGVWMKYHGRVALGDIEASEIDMALRLYHAEHFLSLYTLNWKGA
jgi:hypothetical protein